MSRFLRQSTAIAAVLALVVPPATLAQMPAPDAAPAGLDGTAPQLAAQLAEEIAAGLSPEALTCAAPTQGQPCPEGTPLVTPGGIAVRLADDGSITLAPAEDQELARAAAEDPPTAAELAPTEDEAPDTETPDAEAPAAVPDEATPAPDETEAEPATAAETGAETEADADTEATPPADKPVTQDAPRPPATDAVKADTGRPAEAPERTDAEVSEDDLADSLAAAEAEDEAAESPTADAEAGAGQDAADAAEATPPAEIAVEAAEDDTLAQSLAAAGAETGEVDAEDTAPETRDVTPDMAANRAAEGTAPEAAALAVEDLDAPEAEAETLTIDEDIARSSTEDFATSIAQAMREAAPAPAAATPEAGADGNNRDRDVARALLAGLAGYAVGQLLPDQGQVALNSGDRVVITREDGSQEVLKDDSVLMFRPGAQVQTQQFDDGSSRMVVQRDDGSRVITIRDRDLRVLRRTLVRADGSVVKLIDDTAEVAPVDVSSLPPPARPAQPASLDDEAALRRALEVEAAHSRRFTLGQIRAIAGVRALVAPINIDAITFDTGSAAIRPDQARQLAALGRVIAEQVRTDPAEMFLIEGYTDTVGSEAMNLALSDRRAESLALALTEYFDVPPENLVVQGYGERFLKVPAEGDVRENRRVAVRRITDLLVRD